MPTRTHDGADVQLIASLTCCNFLYTPARRPSSHLQLNHPDQHSTVTARLLRSLALLGWISGLPIPQLHASSYPVCLPQRRSTLLWRSITACSGMFRSLFPFEQADLEWIDISKKKN